MNDKMYRYRFTVLRYIHDITSGEFVNVGVMLHCPEGGYLAVKTRNTYGRIKKVFPSANGEFIKKLLRQVGRSIVAIEKRSGGLVLDQPEDILRIGELAVPRDESSLQWSPAGSGRTSNLNATLEHLYERLVLRNEERREASRDDQDVWSVFSKALQKRNLLDRMTEKRISGSADEVKFAHAWKNGVWHCLEPLSFDLVDPESIKNKARRFVGQMQLVSDASERFRLYLLLGEPTHSESQAAFETARKMLQHLSIQHSVFTESQADELSEIVEAEIEVHDRSFAN